MEHALAISEKINGSDYSSLADQLYALAVLMIDAGRPCDALEYANRAASMLSIASIRNTPGKLHLVSFHMTVTFSVNIIIHILPAEYAHTQSTWGNISETWAH